MSEALLVILKQRYKQNPSWFNFFALLGGIFERWPELARVPLGRHQLMKLAHKLGIEVCEAKLDSYRGISFKLGRAKRGCREQVPLDDGLTRQEAFGKIVSSYKEGARDFIFLDGRLKGKERLFALAHELVHHLLGHLDDDCTVEPYLQELHADLLAVFLTQQPSPYRKAEENSLLCEIAGIKKAS